MLLQLDIDDVKRKHRKRRKIKYKHFKCKARSLLKRAGYAWYMLDDEQDRHSVIYLPKRHR